MRTNLFTAQLKMCIDVLVPKIEVSPVESVEDEEEDGGEDKEESVHTTVLIVPGAKGRLHLPLNLLIQMETCCAATSFLHLNLK